MPILIFFVLFISPALAAPVTELQDTLQGYYVQEYGQSYLDRGGWVPKPSDSDACEKIRYDLRVYSHWYHQAYNVTPHRRSLAQTNQYIRNKVLESDRQKAEARAGYLRVYPKLAALGCTSGIYAPERDPFLDGH